MAGLSEGREGQGQMVFGLDIGTRSIVGTVGYLAGNKFHVMAQRVREHETRAMLDGQIHDISKVGETISVVKKQLEDDLKRNLTEVCIAAAGRVLRTVTTTVEYRFESEKEITAEDIYTLETMGVERSYEEFQKINESELKFYCVGYTPMRYYMNGYQIGNLEGHKAKNIAADLIATFLPDDVVDGLYKAVEMAGLHVANLTLEPIAAIQVAIPEKFRMLNMALVDVGAGTSDISITKEGTITAYGMIPVAGDSLTDIIVQHCLVDFETAEYIKRQAGVAEKIEFQDIIGLPQTITAQEVREQLKPAVEDMTKQVAQCIRDLNGDKPVSAVFVVGGGGTVAGYTDALAEELGIAKERVAIRGREVMQNILFEVEDARMDSLMVTPIGICLSYYEQSNNFIFVEFNGARMKLYDNGRLSVADAAMQAQFTNEDLFPKRGKALTFTVNGKSRMVRGSQGEAAVIRMNGDPADLHTQIHSGDIIEVTASTEGEPGTQELGKLTELAEPLHVCVNGNKISLPKTAEVNGNRENEFYQIKEDDVIKVQNCYSVSEVAEFLDVPLGGDIRVNDTPARPDTKVYENFTISWDMNADRWSSYVTADSSGETVYEEPEEDVETAESGHGGEGAPKEIAQGGVQESDYAGISQDGVQGSETAEAAQGGTTEGVSGEAGQDGAKETSTGGAATENSASVSSELRSGSPYRRAEYKKNESKKTDAADLIEVKVMANDKLVTLHGKKAYVFVDIFDFIDFDLKDSRGRSIVTRVNGRNADYMENLKDGDVIEIYWEENGKKS